MSVALRVNDLSYKYPGSEVEALCGLSIDIPARQRTVICGHNGSGKSTLFLHVMGLLRPGSGSLWLGDAAYQYDRRSLQKLRQRIGLVFQDPELQLIHSTPAEDIAYGLRNAGIAEDEIQTRVSRMITTMNLTAIADKPIHQLSLGQKKRVALAGVLIMEPQVLILDEPTAYLDRQSERLLLDELERVSRTGITVIMATHDMNLAYQWADHIIVLDQGACVASGEPIAIFSDRELQDRYSLERPLILELWGALPERLRYGIKQPRTLEEFKHTLAKLTNDSLSVIEPAMLP